MQLSKLRNVYWIVLTALMATAVQGHADDALNEATIKRWIASQKAFAHWGDEQSAKLDAIEAKQPESENPLAISVADMIAPINEAGLRASAEKALSPFGFKTLEDWAVLTLRITRAAAAIQVEGQQADMDLSQLEKLKSSGRLNAEQLAAVEKAISLNQAILKYLKKEVSKADKDAIRPLLNELQALEQSL